MLKGFKKRFGDLHVRTKLIILHNVFFLVLSGAVYLVLAPESPQARWALLLVLGGIYGLAVLLLETVLMPLYVYRPLRLILEADKDTQRGDRANELIPVESMTRDELGRIMRSRNATVAELRKHEDYLAEALVRLEETAEDLKRKNHMLETARKNLADQDRLVSLGLMSASVAHELNTPLAVLQGSIEKLLESGTEPQTLERVARMKRVTERLQSISGSLLEFARVRSVELGPVGVRGLVEEAWGLVAIDERAARIQFENQSPENHRVVGNADRLNQVFLNVLRNAARAVEPAGTVTVSSRRVEVEGEPWIEIAFEDDGPGIPADVLPNLFEAFVTTRLDARGTGLGLTVAEGIVHQHGGSITASNRAGGGARLEVRLREAQQEVSA